jgi:hypothetical protein
MERRKTERKEWEENKKVCEKNVIKFTNSKMKL